MQFRSSLATEESVTENIFNAISIYMPYSLASRNITAEAMTGVTVDADNYAVLTVNADNYKDILAGTALYDWKPVFNDDTNFEVTLYLIVFDDTGFSATVGDKSIEWNPLSKAFGDLYFISFFKTMFSEHRNGNKVESDPAEATDYNDSNYFDMLLCLSYLCENEASLSFCLAEVAVDVLAKATETDSNPCKVQSLSRADETEHCTTLTGSTLADRAEYAWGYLNLIAPDHTMLYVHNGAFMTSIILAKWFEEKNESGMYLGNKLAKIRLNNARVKPTGLPSPLNSDVNLNLDKTVYTNLDEKHVGYFISVSSASDSNAELVRDRTIGNFPTNAYMMSKWICYQTSQDCANMVTANATLTKPYLTNQATYDAIKQLLLNNIQKMALTGRLVNAELNFPPLSDVVKGQTITGTGVWSATYVDDIESVRLTGTINF